MVRKGSKLQRVPPADRAAASIAARPRRNVYIASLPLSFTDRRVRELAAPSGRIQSVSRIFNDTQTSAEVGHAYCFVCFFTEDEAAACVRRLHDMPVESRRLQVKLSRGGPGSGEPPTLPVAAGASPQPRLVSPQPTPTPTSAPSATSTAQPPPHVGAAQAQAGGAIVANPRPPYNPLAAPPPRHVFVAHSASQPHPYQHHYHQHHHQHHHITIEAAPLNTSAGFVPQLLLPPHHGLLQQYQNHCVVPLAEGHAFHLAHAYSAAPAAPLQYPAGAVEWVSSPPPVEHLSFAHNPHTAAAAAAAPHQGPPPMLATAVDGHAAPASQVHHHHQAWALLPTPHQQSPQNPAPRQSQGSGAVADAAFSTTSAKWATAPDSGAKT